MTSKTKQMKTKEKRKNLSNITKKLYLIIALSPLLYLLFCIFRWPIYNSLLDNYSKTKEAIIINERNILGKGVITKMFTYSYQFSADDKIYTGDSKKRGYTVGDTIQIEYLEYCPSINRTKQNKQ